MNKYLLDANIFIEAHRDKYPFDVVPRFWTKLAELSERKLIFSIDKVKKEICDKTEKDILAHWCENELNADFFKDSTDSIEVYSVISKWVVSSNHYTTSAISGFLATDLADPWLIAYAKNHNFILVSHEISEPNRKNKVKIPDVCSHFGVECINLIQMYRELKETF